MTAEDRVSVLLGEPREAVVIMAIPIIVSLLVSQANVLADRAWCAGLGDDAMSAIAVVMPIYMTIVGFGSGFGVGASAVISRMIGAGRRKDASSSAVQALLFSLVFGIVLTPILLLGQTDLLSLLGKENILELTCVYMMPYTLASVFIVLNGVIGGILNGQGATQYSMGLMIVQALVNIVLDPLLIYGLDMGLQGAAVATVIATVASMAVGLLLILSKRTYLPISRSDIGYDRGCMRMLMKAGVPQMLEYTVMYFMDAVLNYIVLMSAAGSHALTIYSVPDNLMNLIVIPAIAIGSALVPVASSAHGQKDVVRMRSSFRFALTRGIAVVAILAAVVELFPEQFLYIFSYSGEMLDNRPAMAEMLKVMCLYISFFAFTPLCSGYMQALGHPNRSLVVALWRNAVLITFYLIAIQQTDLTAIGWALVFGHMVGAASIFAVTVFTDRQVARTMRDRLRSICGLPAASAVIVL
jgi:putative MATE family efflux protein